MVKKLFKACLALFGIVSGLVVSLILLLDWKEEWLYEKYGKENVLNFMKRFEPFITMEAEKFDDELDFEDVEIATEDLTESVDQTIEDVEK